MAKVHVIFDNPSYMKNKVCSKHIFLNQRTIGPENAHLKPDPGVHVLSHHEMTLTLNTHTPLLNS